MFPPMNWKSFLAYAFILLYNDKILIKLISQWNAHAILGNLNLLLKALSIYSQYHGSTQANQSVPLPSTGEKENNNLFI